MCLGGPVSFGARGGGRGAREGEGEGEGSGGGEGAEWGAGETGGTETMKDLLLQGGKVGDWSRSVEHQCQFVLVACGYT